MLSISSMLLALAMPRIIANAQMTSSPTNIQGYTSIGSDPLTYSILTCDEEGWFRTTSGSFIGCAPHTEPPYILTACENQTLFKDPPGVFPCSSVSPWTLCQTRTVYRSSGDSSPFTDFLCGAIEHDELTLTPPVGAVVYDLDTTYTMGVPNPNAETTAISPPSGTPPVPASTGSGASEPTAPVSSQDGSKPMSGGLIAGIVIVVVAALGIGAAAGWFFRRRRAHKNAAPAELHHDNRDVELHHDSRDVESKSSDLRELDVAKYQISEMPADTRVELADTGVDSKDLPPLPPDYKH